MGLVFGYPYALIFSPSRGLLYGLVVGLFNTVIFTVLNGLVFGVLIERACDFCKASVPEGDHEGRPYISSRTDKTCRGDPRGRPARSTKDTRLLLQRKIVKSRIVYGFICGLLNVLAIGFLIGPLPGLIRGLFIGISYGLLGPLDREIRPTEVVTWSWVSVQRNITRFLGAGLLVGLLYGLVTSLFFGPSYLAHLLFGLIIGASVGLTLGLTSGLSNEKLNDRNRVMPNQGIWNSLWNSVFLGLLYGLVFGVIFGLIYGRILYLSFGSNYVTSFTINSGLVTNILSISNRGHASRPGRGVSLRLPLSSRSTVLFELR